MIKIEIYKARDGWRWRMKRKGRILADSGEAYTRKASCRRGVKSITEVKAEFEIVVVSA